MKTRWVQINFLEKGFIKVKWKKDARLIQVFNEKTVRYMVLGVRLIANINDILFLKC